MPEIGDRQALQRYVLAHLAKQEAALKVARAEVEMAREQIGAMRYLQSHGATEIEVNNDQWIYDARLAIVNPGIEVSQKRYGNV